MGVTTLSKVTNKTYRLVSILNLERKDQGLIKIPPKGEETFGWGIPWATNKEDFLTHHIELSIPEDTNPFCIWQHDDDDGDHVRVSLDGLYHSTDVDNGRPAQVVSGASEVNGYREIRIEPDGTWSVVPLGSPTGPPRWG
jgi:hypothetical protein